MAGLDPAGPPRPSTPKWRLSLGSTKGVDGPVKLGHDGVEESGPASFGIIEVFCAAFFQKSGCLPNAFRKLPPAASRILDASAAAIPRRRTKIAVFTCMLVAASAASAAGSGTSASLAVMRVARRCSLALVARRSTM